MLKAKRTLTDRRYDQLISEFEQFTPEEAQYAIGNLK